MQCEAKQGGAPKGGELSDFIRQVWSAFETRFHQDFVTFPKTLVDFFGDRAKAFLELELDYPCVATVQAMVILSCHEIGNGIDARGCLYSGKLRFDCLAFEPVSD